MKRIGMLCVGVLAFATGMAKLTWADEGLSAVARGRCSFENHCLHCHPASRALRVAKGPEAWRRTLLHMAARHRRVFDEDILADDQSAIVAYLSAAAGPTTE